MLPLVVLAVGGYLVYDSLKKPVKYADGGMMENGGMMAEGGEVSTMSEKEFINKYFGANVFTEDVSKYFDIKNISSSNDAKIDKFIEDHKRDGYTIKKKSYSDFKSVMAVKRKNDGGMMEHGGMMAKGGKVKVGDIITTNTGVKVKVIEYDSMFGGRVKVERQDEYATGKPSQFISLSKFRFEDGGMMEHGGMMAKGGMSVSDRYKAEVGDEVITVMKGKKEKSGYPVYVSVSGYAPQLTDVYATKEIAKIRAKALENNNKK
jgi:hypothetical protein